MEHCPGCYNSRGPPFVKERAINNTDPDLLAEYGDGEVRAWKDMFCCRPSQTMACLAHSSVYQYPPFIRHTTTALTYSTSTETP